jgi:hypothetical protein
MGNSDPILQLLKEFGYSVVRLPRESIRPLQVVQRQGDALTILGELTDLFNGGQTLPAVGPDHQAAFINGKKSRALDINVGLSLLSGIIGSMTGSKLKLDAAYKKASNLTFEFEDVQVSEVNQLAVNKFISGNKVDTSVGGGILKALEEDRLYVITSIVKSKKFKTQATQSDGLSVQVDIPVVKEMVGGAVQIQSGGSSDSNITFEGANPLVFGFQAAQIEFEKGIFRGLKQSKAAESALRGASQEAKFELLETTGPFANLSEQSKRKGPASTTRSKSRGSQG